MAFHDEVEIEGKEKMNKNYSSIDMIQILNTMKNQKPIIGHVLVETGFKSQK